MQPLPWERDAAGDGIYDCLLLMQLHSLGFSATNTHYQPYTASWQGLSCTRFLHLLELSNENPADASQAS